MVNSILESISVFGDIVKYSGGWGWLVTAIKGVVTVFSATWLGIIFFTLVLKLITLPLDIMSRVSMRKNSLKMEEMRPQLEKLQKQYAGDKRLYQQKMMALYKKNGYSMFGGCLPTIVTLVFFIIALTGFSKYSAYQNTEYFKDMINSYSNVAYTRFAEGMDLENNTLLAKDGTPLIITYDNKAAFIDHEKFLAFKDDAMFSEDIATNGQIFLKNNGEKGTVTDYDVLVKYWENANYKYLSYDLKGSLVIEYKYSQYIQDILEWQPSSEISYHTVDSMIEKEEGYINWEKEEKTPADYITNLQREAAAESFKDSNQGFLWIKNIWIADSPVEKEFYSSFSKFKSGISLSKKSHLDKATYDKITFNLASEKKSPNGYFIMVIFVIGSSLLSQWITAKSQKAQMELQSVDGSGAKQQKMMMIIMPIIMAIFAFMYTAAFSIYIVFSSLFSLASTLLINKCVDIAFKKKKEKAELAGDKRIRGGRVVVQEDEQPVVEEKKKDKKNHHRKGE